MAQRPSLGAKWNLNLRQKAGSLLGVLRDMAGGAAAPSQVSFIILCGCVYACTCVCAAHVCPHTPRQRISPAELVGKQLLGFYCNCIHGRTNTREGLSVRACKGRGQGRVSQEGLGDVLGQAGPLSRVLQDSPPKAGVPPCAVITKLDPPPCSLALPGMRRGENHFLPL